MIAARDELESPIDPCRHMVNAVSAMADGSLRGIKLWYARWHVRGCSRCRRALLALQALRRRLLSLASGEEPKLSPRGRDAVRSALDEIDRGLG